MHACYTTRLRKQPNYQLVTYVFSEAKQQKNITQIAFQKYTKKGSWEGFFLTLASLCANLFLFIFLESALSTNLKAQTAENEIYDPINLQLQKCTTWVDINYFQ